MKPIAVTLGDPAGIGSEVVFKAIAQLDSAIPLMIFGDRNYASQAPGFQPPEQFVDLKLSGSRRLRFGQVDAEYGRISLAAIDAALEALEKGACSALVTAPIHKQAIAAAGSKFPGHTELLAARSGRRRYGYDYAMYFDSPSLKIVLLTVHVPLADAIRNIDVNALAALASLTSREYRRLYDREPRLAVAGVNPHAGEGGMFGKEEGLIAEAIERVRAQGIQISGPHPSDTVFHDARRGQHDIVIAIYHDQGLIPIKTVEFDRSVNVTIGLPFLRCSVDHGTAFDIAGKGVANPQPMRYAIEWAARHADKWVSS